MRFPQIKAGSIKWVLAILAVTMGSAQADTTPAVKAAASATVAGAASRVAPGAVVPKVVVAPKGTVTSKGDENQYPSGTIPIPPKPKKEGLEAAGAIKAKAAQP